MEKYLEVSLKVISSKKLSKRRKRFELKKKTTENNKVLMLTKAFIFAFIFCHIYFGMLDRNKLCDCQSKMEEERSSS